MTKFTPLAACLFVLCAAVPTAAQDSRPTAEQVRRELDDARARWRANAIPYYRLRVSTFNPLMYSVAESDVRNGAVLVARRSSGIPGIGPDPGSNWGPFDGQTVETLFQRIEDELKRPGEKVDGRLLPNVVIAKYDARRGHPTSIYFGPPVEARVMDADVHVTVELVESPDAPLVAPSPGEVYKSPVPGRIVNPGRRYGTLFGFGSDEAARIVRRVWPALADEIMTRGVDPYWRSVGWTPRAGLAGSIIGEITLPSGVLVYVMEFQHDGRPLYLLIDKVAVQTAK